MTVFSSRTLTLDDVNEIRDLESESPTVSVSEMKDRRSRTLIYGYDCDRNTFHLYLEDEVFHAVVYDHKNTLLSHTGGTTIPVSATVPNKRVYPETCDYEFCKLIEPRLDNSIPFTTYNAKRDATRPFFGSVIAELNR